MPTCGDYYQLLPLTGVPQGVRTDEGARSPRTRQRAKQREQSRTASPLAGQGAGRLALPVSADSCQATTSLWEVLPPSENPLAGCGQTAESVASPTDESNVAPASQITTSVGERPGMFRIPPAEPDDAGPAGLPTDGRSVKPNEASSCSGQTSPPDSADADVDAEHYDFLVWHHKEDAAAVERICGFLEGELRLTGYLLDRDGIGGQYVLQEQQHALRRCQKVLLLVTPQAMDCGIFKNQMQKSLHRSIERGVGNVVPIYWQMDRRHGPEIMRSIYSLQYDDNCSLAFKTAIAKVFGIRYPPQQGEDSSGSRSKRSPSTKSEPSTSVTAEPQGRRKRFFSFPWQR